MDKNARYSSKLMKKLIDLKLYIKDEFELMLKLCYGVTDDKFLPPEELKHFIGKLESFVEASKVFDLEGNPLKLEAQYFFAGETVFLTEIIDKFALLVFPKDESLGLTKVPFRMIRRCRNHEQIKTQVIDYSGDDCIRKEVTQDFYGREQEKLL